jgi:nucleotide-binding universal stress UspA family protein
MATEPSHRLTYATLMAALTVGRSNAAVLQVARELAGRFDARVIGVAACRPIQVVCQDYSLPAACFDEDRKQIARQLSDAEDEFRTVLKDRGAQIEWRPSTTLLPLSVHVAQQGRGADLVIVPVDHPRASVDATREIDLIDLVMHCSRPVLLVPEAGHDGFDRVLVAWKDTREAQRAAADALPLLARARQVTVLEIAPQEKLAQAREHIEQVIGWLKQHGISAAARVEPPARSNASQLNAIADEMKADLMVAGAYGHTRGQTWVLGGVTHDVLQGRRCILLSH